MPDLHPSTIAAAFLVTLLVFAVRGRARLRPGLALFALFAWWAGMRLLALAEWLEPVEHDDPADAIAAFLGECVEHVADPLPMNESAQAAATLGCAWPTRGERDA